MPIKLIQEGNILSSSTYSDLEEFCLKQNLDITFEFIDGQFCLHSDIRGENPIGIFIDRELERHVNYFKKSSVHKELLARAIGVKGAHRPQVLDLTAGMLGDSLLFLSMNCQVICLERNPLVRFLIESALQNAKHPLLANFNFVKQSAGAYLRENPAPEVIYFDPMFEDVNEKAKPRKEMRIFREFIGEDKDSVETFQQALDKGPKRLVVKRPRLSQMLTDSKPLQFIGKATRYDVYFGQNHGPNESNPLK